MSDTTNQTLGEFIRAARRQRNQSLRELARSTGISRTFLNNLELDRKSPSEPVLSKLAGGLQVPVRELRRRSLGPAMIEFRRMLEADRDLNVFFLGWVKDLRNGKPNLRAARERSSHR